MLKVIFREDSDTKVYSDIENEFASVSLPDTPVIRQILHDIEGAEYRTPRIFTDRFGGGLYTKYLSTGCKAALLVEILGMEGNTDLIDTAECGYNALDAIIMNCRNGSILMQRPLTPIGYDDRRSKEIDIAFNGYRFTNIKRFNYYLFDEFRTNPDMRLAGIEKLDENEVNNEDYREIFKRQEEQRRVQRGL